MFILSQGYAKYFHFVCVQITLAQFINKLKFSLNMKHTRKKRKSSMVIKLLLSVIILINKVSITINLLYQINKKIMNVNNTKLYKHKRKNSLSGLKMIID